MLAIADATAEVDLRRRAGNAAGMAILTGHARVAGIIGWPVGHSRSPRLHGYWLEKHGIAPAGDLVERIFTRAKQADRLLTDAEILEMCGNEA